MNYVPDVSKPSISLSSVEGVLSTMLAELYSIADSSTTARQISIPFVGGCWA